VCVNHFDSFPGFRPELFEILSQGEPLRLGLLEKLRAESRERAKVIDAHERELVAFRREQEEVRTRVEKLLQRIDALTPPESGG